MNLSDAEISIMAIRSIEGCVGYLSQLTNRPQGYPFNTVTIFYADERLLVFKDVIDITANEVRWKPASELKGMASLNFKVAGKSLKDKTSIAKQAVSDGRYSASPHGWNIEGVGNVPEEFITTSNYIPPISDATRKTCANNKCLVEVDTTDAEDYWLAIQFRKAVKEYITETLALNILPELFTETRLYDEPHAPPAVHRIYVKLGNCSERIYQALEMYGKREFSGYPIRLQIPTRKDIESDGYLLKFAGEIAAIKVSYDPA